MQRRDLRTNPRQIATRHNLRRWAAMNTDTDPEPALLRETPLRHGANRSSLATADAAFEFGRFRVLLRRRQLLADGIPVELARAPLISFWSSWRPTACSSQKRSSSAECGRASSCRKRTSRFRSPHCAKRSGRTAMSSARNPAAATDLPVCSARIS